jgi:hypothetical protein
MVELNHNVANINADGLIKGGHGVIVSVHVSKKGSSGAKIILKNGTTSGAPAELTVFGEEIHDLPLLYTFGWGTPIWLQHRQIKPLNSSSGDKIEVWKGSGSAYDDILTNNQWYEFDETYGRLYLRGFLFSIMRKNRIRVTYRYGDTTVPDDVKDACIKLACIDLISTSLRMDQIPIGGSAINVENSIKLWREDIEDCIVNRREVFIIP